MRKVCFCCREALLFGNNRMSETEIHRLAPRATGRDGRCTGCRAYDRINRRADRWDVKQDPQSSIAWFTGAKNGMESYDAWWKMTFGPRGNRPAARWRAKTRNRRGRR